MKKSILTILAILYIVSITGATLHTHFCMGRLAGWSLHAEGDGPCGKCGMEKQEGAKSGCCSDKTELVKIDNDHQGITFDSIKDIVWTQMDLPIAFSEIIAPALFISLDYIPQGHAPPRRSSQPLFIYYQSFLI